MDFILDEYLHFIFISFFMLLYYSARFILSCYFMLSNDGYVSVGLIMRIRSVMESGTIVKIHPFSFTDLSH